MEKKVLTVSLLNNYLKNLIEGDLVLNNIIVQGEVTNLTKHHTGHYYFSIKDENSKVSCMMFSSYVKNLKFPINEGDLVLIYGRVSVYEKTGTYQLYVNYMEPFGLGQELLKIEALKKKLKEEGILDRPKKMIPAFPTKIGLVTSSNGAAVHDFIHTIQSRWNVEIDIFPCLVQGPLAPESIIKALKKADEYGVDTIILGRGGGANEDLSAFNDEGVVRAVIACNTPIISAIGHQIDSSVTDLVSDYACITPTEAGVKATPDKYQIIDNLIGNREYLANLMNSKIERLRQRLLEISSSKALISPLDKLKLQNEENKGIRLRLVHLMDNYLNLLVNQNKTYLARLTSLNPYGVLKKGYSLIYNKDEEVVTSINDLKLGEEIKVDLNDGRLIALVKEKKENNYGK